MKSIGVVGAGQMGAGIAQVMALAGYQVVLTEIDAAALKRGLGAIEQSMDRLIKKGTIDDAAKQQGLLRISTSTSLQALDQADLVIEAVPEILDLKTKVHREIESVVREDAIIATNTSSISVTKLAAATSRPERFIGVHFFHPVPMMGLVEVIRGLQTSDDTAEKAYALVRSIEKSLVISADTPGFIVNRLLVPMINEAIFALSGGVADVVTIDTAMRLGASHPMGPLTLADFVGLDTVLSAQTVLHQQLGESKYRPAPMLVKLVEAGWLGRKDGIGFYDYSGAEAVPNSRLPLHASRNS